MKPEKKMTKKKMSTLLTIQIHDPVIRLKAL